MCMFSRLQWSRQGGEMSSNARDADGIFTIYHSQPSDSGIYTCTAIDRSTGATEEEVRARIMVNSPNRLDCTTIAWLCYHIVIISVSSLFYKQEKAIWNYFIKRLLNVAECRKLFIDLHLQSALSRPGRLCRKDPPQNCAASLKKALSSGPKLEIPSLSSHG